jgi:hypothetical protein
MVVVLTAQATALPHPSSLDAIWQKRLLLLSISLLFDGLNPARLMVIRRVNGIW